MANSLNFTAVNAVPRGGIFELTINDVSLLQPVARILGTVSRYGGLTWSCWSPVPNHLIL